MTTLTITAKGQITVNKQLLALLGVQPGDKLRARFTADGSLNLRPEAAPRKRALGPDKLAGILKWEGQPMTDDDMDAAVRRAVASKVLLGLAG